MKHLFMLARVKILFIVICCTILQIACFSTQSRSLNLSNQEKTKYNEQKEKNKEAMLSDDKSIIQKSLEDTEKGWLDTLNLFGESENERVVCEQARDKCLGKIEVYKYIGTILILIILVYVGLKLSPIKALIPILLFVPILFLISCMIHPKGKGKSMEKKFLTYHSLNTFEIASMLYNVDIGLLKGIAYGETGHLKEKKRIKAISS